jgi:hypothetical protein
MSDRVNDILIILRGMADQLRHVSAETDCLCNAMLQSAALIADQVEATARPGDAKETAEEIGRRILALIEEGR